MDEKHRLMGGVCGSVPNLEPASFIRMSPSISPVSANETISGE